ncbi:Mig-14 family protein [Erwinia sp. OLTSP20]|uniref:GNAT family N-acetyltransferase n=1 Tax=unclassified Erwinia TaxID=2622719 RepID=UPI000C1A65DD|nr:MULTISPECIES: GNAT family N-acetyltransferase [unclassified Erwinia]PIJ49230.1 Mig-14 family protein [Erwinia sp. OAMSP11]PIJ70512.1 Mig-14 family protein [Erwinia sp. OLSSP12]PIJ78738.1 Mig-14 family protein [Erwinia sp. OLCASP19]PIJ81239.1 Mig-14 family protein [Erwinia sp. OLMTSP26]PIJ84488.1 Mig-14 family protein [Erwinia sp. OLMDSP33]
MRHFLLAQLSRWETGSAADYQQCHRLYGGSFVTHPQVLDFLHARFDCQPAFYVKRHTDGSPAGAFCSWSGAHLAGDGPITKKLAMEYYSFNKDELILPLHPDLRTFLPIKTKILSNINSKNIYNASVKLNSNRGICIAKGCDKAGFSSATKNSRNRELKHFIKAGGEIVDQSQYSPEELVSLYFELYEKRWQKNHANYNQLVDMISNLRPFFFGHVLLLNHQPCAFQLIMKAESPHWINFDYINGGYDPSFDTFCPGTVVTWLNIQSAYALCESSGKKMRYSFGRPTGDYKNRWCRTESVGRVISF